VRVTLLLADAVQAVEGKLYVLGGGWSVTGPGPTAMGIAVKVEVPWDQSNRRHSFRMWLVDEDENPVESTTDQGSAPIEVSGQFEVGRPPGLAPGTPLDMPMAFNLGPLHLPEGKRLIWRLDIDGEQKDDWTLRFTTRTGAANSGQ
jgi:hypothetical protein